MPPPTPLPVRRAIRSRSLQGQTPRQIAAELGLPARTVRHLLSSGKVDGPADYSGCGRPSPIAGALKQAILDLCADFPDWGAPFLRLWLPRLGFPSPPSARAIQRLLADQPAPPPRPREKTERPPRPERAHEAWQVDAADQVRLADGSLTCWLRFVDWSSGAVLRSVVFPLRVLVSCAGRAGAGSVP